MLTRAEATQQGKKFAEQWDSEKHTVSQDSMKNFAQDLNSFNSLSAPQKNSLKWAELQGATDGLIKRNVLPNLDVADDKTNLRNCRVVGLTADGDKNLQNDDLVIAIGRKRDNATKAENVVILGQDGKFYQARQVKSGYVRSDVLVAENAAELERKYNREGFAPQTGEQEKSKGAPETQPGKPETKKEKTDADKEKTEPAQKRPSEIAEDQSNRGNPADLEIFRKDLRSFQKYSPYSDETAQRELDRLAKTYSELSNDQQKAAFQDIVQSNDYVYNDVWLRGFFATRPQIAIQRGEDGTIRFSAGWTDGTSLFHQPRNHRIFSEKYEL
jgi:hypothetical protein